MTDADIRIQVEAAAAEIELIAAELPRGSKERRWFLSLATETRREFAISDTEKLEIVLDRLRAVSPYPRTAFVEHLDFSRDEAKRLIDMAIAAGLIETVVEATNGRPVTLLQTV
jgi:hypothetical protein